MKNKLSYSELYYILNELHDCLQQDNYPTLYLETLEEVQHTLLILELLNIAHSSNNFCFYLHTNIISFNTNTSRYQFYQHS